MPTPGHLTAPCQMRGAVDGFSCASPCLSCHLQPCSPSLGSPEVALRPPSRWPQPLASSLAPTHSTSWQEALWGHHCWTQFLSQDPGHILHCPTLALQEEGQLGQELLPGHGDHAPSFALAIDFPGDHGVIDALSQPKGGCPRALFFHKGLPSHFKVLGWGQGAYDLFKLLMIAVFGDTPDHQGLVTVHLKALASMLQQCNVLAPKQHLAQPSEGKVCLLGHT